MPKASTKIRYASAAEVPDAVSCIVAAFVTDPVCRFGWPTPHRYLNGFPLIAGANADASSAHDSLLIADDFSGAALWHVPGAHPDMEPIGPGLAQWTDPTNAKDLGGTFAEMEKWRPTEPHWYLSLLGVDPNARGAGVGAALMEAATTRFDAEGTLSYLESSNPRNISLYLRHGYEVLGEIQVGAGPVVTPMVRRPR